jgi:hypothetical protein
MTERVEQQIQDLLRQIQRSAKAGKKHQARRLALRAVDLAPEQEQPWLYLASLSNPEASVRYLRKALEINPDSQAARKGMRWAADRLREQQTGENGRRKPSELSFSTDQLVADKPALLPWLLSALILPLVILIWLWTPQFSFAFQSLQGTPQATPASQDSLVKATMTYTPTPTPTSTPTPTPTPTFTPTFTPTPTNTPKPTKNVIQRFRVSDIGPNERWIRIDLSQQRLYAYQGQRLVKKFVVSTGLWGTPTVTGTYRIYVKYRSAHMSGPGYYLPNVPYTMYFYKGYGIHGTYWHNNFGTPMSHGCVNMRTPEAGWVFSWAGVGTIVHIHY